MNKISLTYNNNILYHNFLFYLDFCAFQCYFDFCQLCFSLCGSLWLCVSVLFFFITQKSENKKSQISAAHSELTKNEKIRKTNRFLSRSMCRLVYKYYIILLYYTINACILIITCLYVVYLLIIARNKRHRRARFMLLLYFMNKKRARICAPAYLYIIITIR